MELEFLYLDDDLVVINKPSGLLVHRSEIDRHETRFALQLVRNQLGRRVYPVHRLDKPTSGVLAFARSPEVASLVADQWRERDVEKHYLAITRGYMPEFTHLDYAMAPPIRKVLAFSMSPLIPPILSETFEPPRITTKGRAGSRS